MSDKPKILAFFDSLLFSIFLSPLKMCYSVNDVVNAGFPARADLPPFRSGSFFLLEVYDNRIFACLAGLNPFLRPECRGAHTPLPHP